MKLEGTIYFCKLKKGSEELNRKLQSMEDEQMAGRVGHMIITNPMQSGIPSSYMWCEGSVVCVLVLVCHCHMTIT